MENTIYIGLSRQIALEQKMHTLSNNIANINTPGYKANKALFAEFIERPEGMRENISMVLDYGQFRVTENGPIKRTDNPLDVALEGTGFLGVTGPGDQQYYTRAGNFALDTERNLVTQQGYPVLDAGGGAINIPEGQNDIYIDERGNIGTSEGVVGTLMVVEFDSLQRMTPVGNSLYATEQAPIPSETTRVLQGALEGSNTQGVLEMTDMIEVSRAYQSIARMLQNEHDRQRQSIRTLTQTN